MPRVQSGSQRHFPRAVFNRLVREIASQMTTDLNGRGGIPLRWRREAVDAIQEAAESFVSVLFEDAMLCAIHAGRCTVNRADIRLVRRLRGWRRAS